MNELAKKSILYQLIIVITGASIISAIVASVGHYIFTSSLIHTAVSEQANTAFDISQDLINEEYIHINHDLELLRHTPLLTPSFIASLTSSGLSNEEAKTQQLQQIKRLLHRFIESSHNVYDSITLLDNQQKVVAEVYKDTPPIEHQTSDKSHPNNFSLSELFHKINSSNNKQQSHFYGPRNDNGKSLFFAGVSLKRENTEFGYNTIIIAFDIDKLTHHLSHIKVFNRDVAWLFSSRGDILLQPTKTSSLQPFEYLHNNKTPPKNTIILSAIKEGGNPLANLLQMMIVVPPETTQHLLRKSIVVMTTIIFSISLVLIIIAYKIARYIVLPIHHLTNLSQKVAAGDFNVRMPVTRADELGTLGKAFNIMVEELDEQRHELQSLANKDTLTQLPNRRQFEEHLAIVINGAKRNNQSIAVMYIDLDQFKDTNDSFGHPAGDKLIRGVSTRLQNTIRQSDLVARLGGDEFAIILNPHKNKKDTEFVAKKILSELNKPFLIENQQIFSGGSIGISIFPEHGDNLTELVKNADAAMYKAKSMGRNIHQFYSKNLTEKANERIVLGALIRNAIVNDQFTLHYQPKISFTTKQIIGAEALLRWQHKGRAILPEKIINVAESSGFIEKVDSWVLNRACSQIKQWEQTGKDILPISINISGRLLVKNKITDMLKQAIYTHSLDPKWIEIEITENDLVSDYENTQKILEIIHTLGVKIAIDDFGTGYSSLSYLKDMSADTLKIDRKFVVNAMTNHADRKIASAIVTLARSLNMHVVVEGIETEEQEEFFKELGAHSAQGYLYAKAMSMDDFIQFSEDYPSSPQPYPSTLENTTIRS